MARLYTDNKGGLPVEARTAFTEWAVLGVLVLALVGIAGCASKGSVRSLDLKAMLKEAEKKAYIVNQFGVDIEKRKHSGLFKRDMHVQGRMVFQKPDKLRLALKGDVNVEILSNGKVVTLIHDGKDVETFRVKGNADSARFSDPLMQLINGLGTNLLRQFRVVQRTSEGNTCLLEISPGDAGAFETVEKVYLWLAESGQPAKGRVLFRNGNYDETVFRQWRMLAGDDPEIVELNARLEHLASSAAFPVRGSDPRPWELALAADLVCGMR
ncbi:MAG: outer membrane lipoprotein carrier protein LolA [Thermodesulfobacteriota bacterium]